MILRILQAGSPQAFQQAVARALDSVDEERVVESVETIEDLRRSLSEGPFHILMLEVDGLGEGATTLLEELRSYPEAPFVLALAARVDPGRHAALIRAGADAVVETDTEPALLRDALIVVVERLRESARLASDRSKQSASRLEDFASSSPAMRRFLETVRKVVDRDCSLLVLGETGVGKEYLSRAIHQESHRSGRSFVPVNCGALPEALLESELFGHARGAFTGADRARRGHFELAHGGTLFLDEIGEIPLHLQVKLLRVLQDKEVQPVGSEKSLTVDARVIAATNRDLKREVEEGRFRSDLLYRLNVVTLQVPALRQRREDIPSLVESHLQHFRRTFNSAVFGVQPAAMELFVAYDWPGNVRELANVVERAVLLANGEEITPDDLPEELLGPAAAGRARGSRDPADEAALLARPFPEARDEVLRRFELRYLSALLGECKGRIGEAARRAGITPRSLYEKMKRHGLEKESFRG